MSFHLRLRCCMKAKRGLGGLHRSSGPRWYCAASLACAAWWRSRWVARRHRELHRLVVAVDWRRLAQGACACPLAVCWDW